MGPFGQKLCQGLEILGKQAFSADDHDPQRAVHDPRGFQEIIGQKSFGLSLRSLVLFGGEAEAFPMTDTEWGGKHLHYRDKFMGKLAENLSLQIEPFP